MNICRCLNVKSFIKKLHKNISGYNFILNKVSKIIEFFLTIKIKD